MSKSKARMFADLMGEDGNIKYWRDEEDVHHVPKRKLEDLIIG